MNELLHIAAKYFQNEQNSVKFYGNQEDVCRNVFSLFDYVVPFEKPDGYAKVGNQVLIIEHFEFDATKKTTKGSTGKRQQVIHEKNFEKEATEQLKTCDTVKHSQEIATEISCEYYLNNLLEVFTNHYDKIESYKEELRKKGILSESDTVKTLFVIENSSIFGSLAIHKQADFHTDPIFLEVLLIDKFLEQLKTASNLDYILSLTEYTRIFLDLNFINECITNQISIDDYKMIPQKIFEQQVAIKIPQEQSHETRHLAAN